MKNNLVYYTSDLVTWSHQVTTKAVKGFPYMVHFKVFPDIKTIKVTAVFSTHRDPKIWEEKSK